jgi:hypothetical protein
VSHEFKDAVNEEHIEYNTLCDLKVLSTSINASEHWDADFRFFASDNESFLVGLHPERSNLSIRNGVFKRGTMKWDFQWVDVSYPSRDQELQREYTFNFNNTERVVTITCRGQVRLFITFHSEFSILKA